MKQNKIKNFLFNKRLHTSLDDIKPHARKTLWYEPNFSDTKLGYLSSQITFKYDETIVNGKYNVPMLKTILREKVSEIEFDYLKPRLSHLKLAAAILWFINSVSRGVTACTEGLIERNDKVFVTGSFAFLMWYVVAVLNRKHFSLLFGYSTTDFFFQMKTQILMGRPGDLDIVTEGSEDLDSTLTSVAIQREMDVKTDRYDLFEIFSESEKKFFVSHKKFMFCLTDKTLDFNFFKRKIDSF